MQGMALERSRKERGFTQEATAKLLGVSQPFLSQMENGQRPVQEAVATRAFELLGEPTLLPLDPNRRQDETSLANELGALGYPGFAPFAGQPSRNPAELLLDALDRPDLDHSCCGGTALARSPLSRSGLGLATLRNEIAKQAEPIGICCRACSTDGASIARAQ